jgi:hypothetical protein
MQKRAAFATRIRTARGDMAKRMFGLNAAAA